MPCAIWHCLYNLKNVKNTHGGMLLLVNKSNTLPWVFLTFFKLHKWYQTAQRTTYVLLTKKQFLNTAKLRRCEPFTFTGVKKDALKHALNHTYLNYDIFTE